MQKWEYLTYVIPTTEYGRYGFDTKVESAMNNWGQVGWELVTVQVVKEEAGSEPEDTLLLVFKRPIESRP